MSTRLSRIRAIYRGRSLPWAAGSGGNIAIKRAWWGRPGGFDERLGAGSGGLSAEDMDFLYRLLRGGAAVCYAPHLIDYTARALALRGTAVVLVGYARDRHPLPPAEL